MTDILAVKCSCQNCHFVKDPGFKESSTCLRYPPTPVPTIYEDPSIMARLFGDSALPPKLLVNVVFIQPTVFPDGFCGEWRQIE